MKYYTILFGLLLLVSCSSDDMTPVDDSLEIQLVSGAGDGITDETRGEGVISSPLTANLPISLLHQERSKGGSYPAYTQTNFIYAELKHSDLIDGQYRILNNPKLYYRQDGGDTRFVGWSPHAEGLDVVGSNLSRWNAANRTVYIDVDGSTDILLAQGREGNVTNRFGTHNYMEFAHVLTKVTVWVALEKEEYAPYWEKISTIRFKGKQQECQLKFPESNATGESYKVTSYFPASSTHLLMRGKGSTGGHNPITLTTTKTEVGYAMFAPHTTTSDVLTIFITTAAGSEHTVNIPYGSKAEMRAGGAYDIYLTFNVKEVSATAEIKPWGKDNVDEAEII